MVRARRIRNHRFIEEDLNNEEKTEVEVPLGSVEPQKKLWKDFCVFYTRMESYSSSDELETIKRNCLLRKAALLEKAMQAPQELPVDELRPPIEINIEPSKLERSTLNPVSPRPEEEKRSDSFSRIPEPLLDSIMYQELVNAGKAINGKTKDDDEEFDDSYHYFSR